MYNNVWRMHGYILWFIQTLPAYQQNTQIHAVIIQLNLLGHISEFQSYENWLSIYIYFVVKNVYLHRRIEHALFPSLSAWLITFKHLNTWSEDSQTTQMLKYQGRVWPPPTRTGPWGLQERLGEVPGRKGLQTGGPQTFANQWPCC